MGMLILPQQYFKDSSCQLNCLQTALSGLIIETVTWGESQAASKVRCVRGYVLRLHDVLHSDIKKHRGRVPLRNTAVLLVNLHLWQALW